MRWCVGLAGVGLLLTAVFSFALFLRLVALAGTLLFVFSVAVMLLTFRKARRVSPVQLFSSMATSLLCLAAYTLVLGMRVSGGAASAALMGGVLIGAGWGLATPVRARNGVVQRAGGVGYLAVWGLILAVNQLIALGTGRPPPVATALLFFGTGIVLGNSGILAAGFFRARAAGARG